MTSPRRAQRRPGRFQSLADADLIDLLYSAGDELPRDVVDELLRRGPRVIPLLHEIVADKSTWTQPLPHWWAAVHATYVLGAMESAETLIPLLTALRWADAFDCDWVTEDLPSILGKLGGAVRQPLLAILTDETAGPGARSIALSSLAAASLTAPFLRSEVLERAAEILRDAGGEDLYLRQTAANILLDFRVDELRELLMSFGKEEASRREEDPDYQGAFYDWEVDDFLEGRGEAGDIAEYYARDWLAFYDPEEIERRQERWAREREEAAQATPAPETSAGRRELRAPCPCGSGKPFEACCYLKVH